MSDVRSSSIVPASAYHLLIDSIAHWAVRKIVQRSRRTGFIKTPMVVAHSDEIGMRVISAGSFELTQFEAVDMLLDDPETLIGMKRDLDGTFVDVGANIGLYSTRYASRFSNVLAIEANPATFHVLQANILLSRFDNIDALCVGASNANTASQIHVASEGMIGWSRLDKPPWWQTYSVDIKLDTLDNIIKSRAGGRVSLLKIDVEGHELQVLQGARETLRDHGPIVLFEALDQDVGRQAASILLEAQYRVFFRFERKISIKGFFRGLPVRSTEVDPHALPTSSLICAVR